jgi:hypothetical protein
MAGEGGYEQRANQLNSQNNNPRTPPKTEDVKESY